jgi:hypothetical protein
MTRIALATWKHKTSHKLRLGNKYKELGQEEAATIKIESKCQLSRLKYEFPKKCAGKLYDYGLICFSDFH